MRTQSPQKNQLVRGSRSKLKRKKYRKIKNFFSFLDKDKQTYSTPKLLNKNLKNAQSTIWLNLALMTSQIEGGPYYTSSVHKVSVKIVRQSYLEPKSCKVWVTSLKLKLHLNLTIGHHSFLLSLLGQMVTLNSYQSLWKRVQMWMWETLLEERHFIMQVS